MADQAAPEVKKKGFFSRKKEAPAPAPAGPAATAKPTPVRTAPPQVRPVIGKPAAPQAEPRISLELMPQVERRIDRMQAAHRRAALAERYERKYGEKLEVPKLFVPLEEEAEAKAPPDMAKPGQVAGPAPAPAVLAAPKPAAPAAPVSLPPKDIRPPAPAPAAAAKPAVAPAPRPAAPRPAAAPTASKPAAPLPPLPEGQTLFQYLWPQIWPFWGLVFRRYAKWRWPDNKRNQYIMTAIDIPMLLVWFIPRLVLFWPGLALWAWKLVKKRRARSPSKGEPAPLPTD